MMISGRRSPTVESKADRLETLRNKLKNDIRYDDLDKLMSGTLRPGDINMLSLYNPELDHHDIETLCGVIENNPRIRLLSIRGSKFGDEGATAIANLLSSGRCHIRSLMLDSNNISKDGARAVAAAIQSSPNRLTLLSLDSQQFNDFCNSDEQNHVEVWSAFRQALQSKRCRLTSLYLGIGLFINDLDPGNNLDILLEKNKIHNAVHDELRGLLQMMRHVGAVCNTLPLWILAKSIGISETAAYAKLSTHSCFIKEMAMHKRKQSITAIAKFATGVITRNRQAHDPANQLPMAACSINVGNNSMFSQTSPVAAVQPAVKSPPSCLVL